MLKRVVLGCVVAVGLSAAACGGDDGGGDNEPDGGGSSCGTDTYNSYVKGLISSNCIVCHAATPVGNTLSLDTYAKVKAEQDHIIAHAVKLEEPSMPYGMDPMPQADRNRLEAWFTCGAPE